MLDFLVDSAAPATQPWSRASAKYGHADWIGREADRFWGWRNRMCSRVGLRPVEHDRLTDQQEDADRTQHSRGHLLLHITRVRGGGEPMRGVRSSPLGTVLKEVPIGKRSCTATAS